MRNGLTSGMTSKLKFTRKCAGIFRFFFVPAAHMPIDIQGGKVKRGPFKFAKPTLITNLQLSSFSCVKSRSLTY